MPIKLLYFLLYATLAFIAAYVSPYLHERGLSDTQIGFYIGLGSLASAVSPILFGGLADKIGSAAQVLRVVCILSGILLIAFSYAKTALMLGTLYIVSTFIRTPSLSLLDGLTFRVIDSHNKKADKNIRYESFRIWGSIGFAVGCVAIGLTLYLFNLSVSYAHLLAGFLFFIVYFITRKDSSEREVHDTEFSSHKEKFKSVWRLVKTKTIIFLFLSLALFNISGSIFDIFHGRYLEEMGLAPGWLGPFWAIAVFFEVAFIYFATKYVDTFGIKKIIATGVFCMALRLLCYASGASLITLIIAQLAHGPMAMGLYVLPQKFLNSRIPSQLRNTMLGVYRAICFGIPQLFGPWIAGMISDKIKGEDLIGLQGSFWLAFFTCLLGLIIFIFGFKAKNA